MRDEVAILAFRCPRSRSSWKEVCRCEQSGSDKDVTSDGGGGKMLENRGGIEGGAEHGAAPCLRGGRAFWTAGVRTRLQMDASLGNVL